MGTTWRGSWRSSSVDSPTRRCSTVMKPSASQSRMPCCALLVELTTMLTLTNPVTQQLRNHLMPMLSGLGAVQHQIAVQDAQLSIDYDDSPIVSEYHHGRFGHVRFAGGPKAGDRAPDSRPLQTADGTAVRLYDLLRGVHHTLVLFGGPEPDAASWQDLIAIAAGRCANSTGHRSRRMSSWMERASPTNWLERAARCWIPKPRRITVTRPICRRLYLIRPDGYIGFRSRPADRTALTTYLDPDLHLARRRHHPPGKPSRRPVRKAISAVLSASSIARSYAARDSWLRPTLLSRSARVAWNAW